MFTVPNPERLTIYKDDAVAKLLRTDFQTRFGEHAGVIYPVTDLKVNGEEIKNKDTRNGLAWNGREFLPFVLEHPNLGTEFAVRMQSIAPAEGDVVGLIAKSGSEDECTFSALQKEGAQSMSANLVASNPAAVGAFGRHLRTHFGRHVVTSTADGKGGATSVVVAFFTSLIVWLVLMAVMGLASGTAESLDKGGRVFFVLIPFGIAWGWIQSVPLLERLLLVGTVPFSLWLGYSTTRKSRGNARAICEALEV